MKQKHETETGIQRETVVAGSLSVPTGHDPRELSEDADGSRAVDALLVTLAEEGRRHQPGLRNSLWMLSFAVVALLLAIAFLVSVPQGDGWAILLPLYLLVSTFALKRAVASRKQQEAARTLAQHRDLRAVGPLVEALTWPEKVVQDEAALALTHLLPRMKASDAGLLNTKQRGILYSMLRGSSATLTCAILQALEQVGDAAAVPHVERLADRPARTSSEQKVRAAAVACLPALRERVAREGLTLLRSSAAPDVPDDMLLRPAGTTPDADLQVLLRPCTSGDDSEGAER